jgi:hypothetical protein
VEFFNTAFIAMIVPLVLQGWTVPWLARRLAAPPAEVVTGAVAPVPPPTPLPPGNQDHASAGARKPSG